MPSLPQFSAECGACPTAARADSTARLTAGSIPVTSTTGGAGGLARRDHEKKYAATLAPRTRATVIVIRRRRRGSRRRRLGGDITVCFGKGRKSPKLPNRNSAKV